jgi:hypothetical protein
MQTTFEKPTKTATTTTEPESPDRSNALDAMHNGKFKIPGDTVNKATADLPDAHRSAIRRFHGFYIENDLSLDETAKLIGYTGGALSLLFRGRYQSKIDDIANEIISFFDLQDKRSQARKLNFIPTELTRRIWNVCTAALEFQRIAFIFGDQQIGKSEALIAFRDAHNHGNTIYIAMPTGGALIHFLTKLAEQLKISPHLGLAVLRRRIINSFDDRMLLIVDEAHQAIPENGRSAYPLQTIEFIRELFNEKHCGVVFAATNVFRDAMEKGDLEKVLRQTLRRRLCYLQLPSSPTQKDLNTFAAAYGLPPSDGAYRALEKQMVEDEALGMWLTLLRMGAKLAAQAKKTMTWAHVQSARAGLRQLEGN